MKRALLVGVDDYNNFSRLGGCVNDVKAIHPLLASNEDGSPNFACQTRTTVDDPVTRDGLLGNFDALLAGGADVALAYFAGHGYPRDSDVVLVTTDGTEATPGVALSELLAKVSVSPVGEILLILDCCFAGAAAGVPQLGSPDASLKSGVSILAASRSDQTAAETPAGRGLFSTHLCAALDGGAADVLGKTTVAGLYAYLDESFGAWEQRPAFKVNLERLHELRACAPAVPLDELRRLPQLFPSPFDVFPLDASYEPTEEPKDATHEAIFAIFQHYRDAKLLQIVGADHMYYAAMNEAGCRLTPLGRHYHHLAATGRF
jgi:hypothetical protein